MNEAPVIDTERLCLRGHVHDDLAELAAMWADKRFVAPLGVSPYSTEESWARLLRYAGHWALLQFGPWAVEEKASGRLVGEVGLFDFKRDLPPAYVGRPEQGWAFAPDVHGRGYATEAVSAALDWGARRFSPFEPFCIIAPDNAPSLRVAEKVGFQRTGSTLFQGRTALLFSR